MMPRVKKKRPKEQPKELRRRLDADVARALILDVTEKRLAAVGPSGIRLQEVAREAGVSHPTVLHHFGSREHLVKAVIARSLKAINESLIVAINASAGDETKLETILENVAVALESSGNARVMMWLALEGHRIDPAEAHLADVVDAAHALRLSRREGKPIPSRDDTARSIVLTTLALLATAVMGEPIFENAGLAGRARDPKTFRAWLAKLLIAHLDA
jgi:AcrR family transcriptional regulator